MGSKSSTSNNHSQPKHTISEEEFSSHNPATRTHTIKLLFLRSTKWRCSNPTDFAFINKLRPKFVSRSNLSQCNPLQELTLNFDQFNSQVLQETHFKTLFFLKAQNLKSLTFSRTFNSFQDFNGFQVFPGCLKYMKNLTTLKVHLNISVGQVVHDPNVFLTLFFVRLKSLSQLQKLEFTIVGSETLNNAHIEPLTLALGSLKNLHTLELNIPHIESPSEFVISLAKSLSHLSYLANLKLKFVNNRNPHLSYKAVEIFTKSIASLPLRSLHLALSDQLAHLENLQSHTPLLSVLSGYKDRTNFHLDLSAFPPQKFKDFSHALKNPHQLKSLSLVLPQFDDDKSVEGLSKFLLYLKAMPDLNTLNLNFSGEKLCDQEVDLIARNLDSFQNLHRLKLTFQKGDQLSAKALDSIQAAFGKLIKLEYLEVDLWRNIRFENSIVNKFLCGLVILKNLKELVVHSESSLSFYPNPAWKPSVKKLKSLKYLTKIEINRVRFFKR